MVSNAWTIRRFAEAGPARSSQNHAMLLESPGVGGVAVSHRGVWKFHVGESRGRARAHGM